MDGFLPSAMLFIILNLMNFIPILRIHRHTPARLHDSLWVGFVVLLLKLNCGAVRMIFMHEKLVQSNKHLAHLT